MKRTLIGGGLAALLLCAAPQAAWSCPPATFKAAGSTKNQKNVRVTAKNFTSLVFEVSGGIAGIRTTLTVRPGEAVLTQNRPESTRSAQLSDKELKALLQVLNAAHFPRLQGKYVQPNLADGFNEVVTLSLRTPGGKTQTFVVENYGETAPKAYYRVTEHLRALIAAKFPPPAL